MVTWGSTFFGLDFPTRPYILIRKTEKSLASNPFVDSHNPSEEHSIMAFTTAPLQATRRVFPNSSKELLK